MNKDKLELMGAQAYKQSIYPYTREPVDDNDIGIVGLDTEFFSNNDKNVLVSWQLGTADGAGVLFTKPLTVDSMVTQGYKLLGKSPRKLFFITYFVVAEAQFFLTPMWNISEYKGKYRFNTTHNDVEVQVVDLNHWFPREKLSKVAELFGVKKLDYPIVEKMNKIRDGKISVSTVTDNDEFREYAINDAVITAQIFNKIREFFLGYGIDILNTITAAGTSAALFRSKYVTTGITQFNTNLRRLAMLSSWGGRTECFYRGKMSKCINYDAYAHHPSSALCLGVLPMSGDWHRVSRMRDWLKMKGGLGCVSFKYPAGERYPCLPVYDDGNLLFPLEGESYCSLEEVKEAVGNGAKVSIVNAYGYNNGTDCLQGYLAWLAGLRAQETTDVGSRMWKLMMNSIVGKLFQKSLDSYDLNAVAAYAHEHRIPPSVAMQIIGLPVNRRITVGSCFYPEWYALILGYARANISRLVRINNALMVSSDSLIISHKLEGVTDQIKYSEKGKGVYVGYRCKLYRIGNKLAHHGVHNKTIAGSMLEKFLADEQDVLYDVSHIVMLKEAWRQNLPFGVNMQKYMSVSSTYDYKRKLLADGWTVPWKNTAERSDFLCKNKSISHHVKLLTS